MPPAYPELLIMRHGQTVWNRAGIMQGSRDSELTGLGRSQARELNGLLARAGLTPEHRAWVSPQGRAQATAGFALKGHFAAWTTDARLAEIHVGEFEGLTFEDAVRTHPAFADRPGHIGWQFHAPGGETYAQFRGRVQSWLDDLKQPAVVVSHGITSRVMRAVVLGLGEGELGDLPGGQGIIHRVRDGRADILAP